MLYNKTKNRLSIFLAISVISIGVIIFIIKTLEDNVLYFYSPSDIKKNNEIAFENKIKVGGMVKKGSIKTSKNEIKFIRSLKLKKNRIKFEQFIVEGEKLVDELIDSSMELVRVYST